MIESPHSVEDVDRVYLLTAMVMANNDEILTPEDLVARVDTCGCGHFKFASERALNHVFDLNRQDPDDWDGVAWYERLCASDKDSLANRLVDVVEKSINEQNAKPTDREIRKTVIAWLNDSGL